jgi:hemerythrin-like metal-binding protein
MPLSRLIFDLDTLTERFNSNGRVNALTFDELRLAVARLNETRRQLDIASQKLGPVMSLAETHIIYNQVDFPESEAELNERFLIHERCITGHAAIDEEHRELMTLGNRVFAVACGPSSSAANVSAALDHFASNAIEHFRSEEALMQANGYPQTIQHQSMHERMREYLIEMRDLALSEPLAVAIKIERFLGSWFIWHMQHDDAQLAHHLRLKKAN